MKKQTKIKGSSLQMRSPAAGAVLYWLLLEHLHAPEWVYGAYWTLMAIMTVAYIASMFTEVTRDVPGFGDDSR
jgi:hypothetical protein